MVLTVEPPSSNPPAGGSQRPRPLNTSSSSGESELGIEEDELSPPTKSPDSQRVLKRARFTSPGLEAHVDAPFLAPITLPPSSSTHQPPPLRLPEEPAPSTPSLPTTSHDVPVDQLKHLESLVDSVLAAVVIIQAATPQLVVLSPHTRRALELLNKLVAPTSATTCSAPQPKPRGPTMPSYAQATKGSRSTHAPVEKNVKPSPAGHQPSRNRTHPKSPQQPRHSAYRLIVRWPGHPVPQSPDSLQDFISNFKKRIGPSYRRNICSTLELAGANVTKSGNVVIHTKAPQTASQLLHVIQLNECSDIAIAGQAIPDFQCPTDILPEVELDVPWHGVVIHDIPAQPLLESYWGTEVTERLWDVVTEQIGLPGKDIRDVRVLCRDEDMEKKDRLSIRIMLDDPRLCEHLCRNNTFLFETPCRVSPFRPRKKRRQPPTSSSS
jgi:hypothetical protein